MALNPYDRGGQRRGGGHHQSRGPGGNPFEMMNAHMTQMQNMMDSAFGDMHGGGRGGRGGHGGGSLMESMMGGGMGSMMMGGGMGSMMGGGGGGSSFSSSSCCYSSSCSGPGGQPHVVQYSSSSQGVQRPGEEMVHETHRNYRDSTGQEQIGVSRRIGDRGRSIVAERRGDGTEQRTDNLINVNDGTQFDREWRGNAAATQINQARTQMASITQGRGGRHDPFAMPPMGGMLGGGHATTQQRPTLTNEDREAARAGARRHEEERARIIDEARKQREAGTRGAPQIGYSTGGRSGGPPSQRGGGGGGDAALATRLAREEARRAGMY